MIDDKKIVVNYLRKVDRDMVSVLYDHRFDRHITFEECVEKWENTLWHKVIMNQIKELELDEETDKHTNGVDKFPLQEERN